MMTQFMCKTLHILFNRWYNNTVIDLKVKSISKWCRTLELCREWNHGIGNISQYYENCIVYRKW